MQKIKENLINIKPSATLAINELSQNLEKKGKKIYKFGLGQSPFPIPDTVVKELKLNAYQKDYLNVSGLLELRKEIAKYHSKKNKYSYSADNVIIGPGSKELIFQTQLIMNGDVLLPSPSWVSYAPQAKIINKKIHWLHTSAKTNWHLDPQTLEDACLKIQSETKLLIINSPNNPTGTTHDDFINLAKVAKKYNIIIIADEIYAELDFKGVYKSLTHYYPEGTIISSGLSKWCGAGGWRLGSFVFPNELEQIKQTLRSVASETFTAVSAPIQYAAIAAYSNDYSHFLINSRKILQCIATYIYNELKNAGIQCQKPMGGFYMLCDFSNVIKNSNEILDSPSLCQTILNDTGFAMLPGSDFGIQKDRLISRIAFVDFEGKKALNLAHDKQQLSYDFLEKACPKIIQGINALTKWIANH
jgi:aspartate aminotransferase